MLDYIKNRAAIRTRIAKQLNISVELVKTIFTAIGFGAELKNNQFNAIRKSLAAYAGANRDKTVWLEKDEWNKLGADEFERLASNDIFKNIYEELQQINETILRYLNDETLVIGKHRYSDIDAKTGKKRNARQKLAWVYQALEAQAMMKLTDCVFELTQQQALLTTHDCVYYKQRLSSEAVKDITYLLSESYPYLRFEHEKIYPICGDEQFAQRFAEYDEFVSQHTKLMAEQTELAKNYKPKASFVTCANKPAAPVQYRAPVAQCGRNDCYFGDSSGDYDRATDTFFEEAA